MTRRVLVVVTRRVLVLVVHAVLVVVGLVLLATAPPYVDGRSVLGLLLVLWPLVSLYRWALAGQVSR